jgi:hypothetical protein
MHLFISLKMEVRGNIDGQKVFLSRFVMNYIGDLLIDHINNNPLDNRKEL